MERKREEYDKMSENFELMRTKLQNSLQKCSHLSKELKLTTDKLRHAESDLHYMSERSLQSNEQLAHLTVLLSKATDQIHSLDD